MNLAAEIGLLCLPGFLFGGALMLVGWVFFKNKQRKSGASPWVKQ